MIVVGDNLQGLIQQHNIVEDLSCFDDTSISLGIDNLIIHVEPTDTNNEFIFGDALPITWVKEIQVKPQEFIVLPPKGAILACSYEKVKIPLGYFGLLQTKGSLARLFVTVHCCDGQIEPGFIGKITFEIVNFSNMTIKIRPKQKIADLFIFKASTKRVKLYKGRYQNPDKPTIQLPEK